MSCFHFDITYVKGEYNKVADCLSRYFESDSPGEEHTPGEYIQVDYQIDPECDDLPTQRTEEIQKTNDYIQAIYLEAEEKIEVINVINDQPPRCSDRLRKL